MGDPSATELNASKERLTTSSHKLAEAMYKANAAGPSASGEGAASGTPSGAEEKKEEGVIDAEYVDVEDKK